MAKQTKKPTKKKVAKKTVPKKTRADHYEPKLKVDASFIDIINAAVKPKEEK